MTSGAACPGGAALESVAEGTCRDAAVLAHVGACEACRAGVAEIVENRRFLADHVSTLGVQHRPETLAMPRADAVPGYEIIGKLGHGGQAVVYKAIQLATHRRVALKMSALPLFHDSRERHRFENEITLVAAMRHPYVVTVYDSGVTPEGRFYIAMEYIRGLRLDEWARRQGEATGRRSAALRAKLELMVKVCDAVQSAHTRGIMHRDLKPSNILVDSEDNPRLLDFGVARTTVRSGDLATLTGQFAGTPAYASPEQVAGSPDQIDTRTDVYSLGVVLHEVVLGRTPYRLEGSIQEIVRRITTAEPDFRADGALRLDEELETILRKAMAKDRERRYQTAAALGQDLRSYLAGEAIEARRDSTLYVLRKSMVKHRGALLLGGAAVTALVGVTATFLVVLAAKNFELRSVNESVTAANRDLRLSMGRMQAASGQTELAEKAIWPELLRAMSRARVPSLRDPRLGLEGPPDVLRAWWGLAELYARQPCAATWNIGSTFGLCNVAGSSTDLRVLTADGRAEVRRLGEDAPVESWAAPAAAIGSHVCTWSDDGSLILCSDGASAWMIDARRGVELSRVQNSEGWFNMWSALSADGRRVIGVGHSGRLALFAAPSLSLEVVAEGRYEPSYRAVISADGRRAVAISSRGRMTLLDAATGRIIREAPPVEGIADGQPSQDGYPRLGRFSPDGRNQAACTGGTCYLWRLDLPDQPMRALFAEGKSTLNSVLLSSDGSRLATTSWDNQLRLWDVEQARVLATFGGLNSVMGNALWVGDHLATATADKTIRIWEFEPGRWLRSRWMMPGSVNSLHHLSSGELICGGTDGVVRVLGPSLADAGPAMTGHAGTVRSVAVSPDGRLAASTGVDRTMRLWDRRSGAMLDVFEHPAGEGPEVRHQFTNIAISADGRGVVSGGRDGRLWIWEVGPDGKISGSRSIPAHQGRLVTPGFSADGRVLATVGADGECRLWTWPGLEPIRSLSSEDHVQVRTACFRNADAEVVTGDDRGSVTVWDARAGTVRQRWQAGPQQIFIIAAHPGGVLVATGDRSGAVKLWDARTGQSLATLIEEGPDVFGLSFSPDGRSLAFSTGAGRAPSGEMSARIGVWDLTYYARHLAGNEHYWKQRVASEEARSGAGSDRS